MRLRSADRSPRRPHGDALRTDSLPYRALVDHLLTASGWVLPGCSVTAATDTRAIPKSRGSNPLRCGGIESIAAARDTTWHLVEA